MGSTLPPRERLRLQIRARISGGDKRWLFRLYTNQNDRFDAPLRRADAAATTVVSGGNEQEWELTVDTAGLRWVVAYASTEPGRPGAATQHLVSAPLWLNDR